MRAGLMAATLSTAILTLTCACSRGLAESDDHLVEQVRHAITRHRLVERPDCLAYLIARNIKPGIDQVEVRELQWGTCVGSPGTEPRLFEVWVNQRTHVMTADAADPAEGTLEPPGRSNVVVKPAAASKDDGRQVQEGLPSWRGQGAEPLAFPQVAGAFIWL